MKVGIYTGSFDPFTLGHSSVIEQALEMFDTIYVVVGVNPAKKPLIDLDTRMQLIIEWADGAKNGGKIVVLSVQNEFLADTAKRLGGCLIRGIRNSQDYDYEQGIFDVNRVIAPSVPTVYFFTDQKYRNISSSLVKGMIGFENWEERVANFVPPATLTALQDRGNPKFLV